MYHKCIYSYIYVWSELEIIQNAFYKVNLIACRICNLLYYLAKKNCQGLYWIGLINSIYRTVYWVFFRGKYSL